MGSKKSHRQAKWPIRRTPPQKIEGIALILRATLIGLLIAIPALISWSYFSKKVEVLAVEMEALCDEFVRRQYAEPRGGIPGPGTIPNTKS